VESSTYLGKVPGARSAYGSTAGERVKKRVSNTLRGGRRQGRKFQGGGPRKGMGVHNSPVSCTQKKVRTL